MTLPLTCLALTLLATLHSAIAWGGHLDLTLNRSGTLLHTTFPRTHTHTHTPSHTPHSSTSEAVSEGMSEGVSEGESEGVRKGKNRDKYIANMMKKFIPIDLLGDVEVHVEIVNSLLEMVQTLADKSEKMEQFSNYLTPLKNSPLLFQFPYDNSNDSMSDLSLYDDVHVVIEDMVMHVQLAVYNARQAMSKLIEEKHSEVLKLDGMSSVSGRHLLNNLCSALNTRYLEVGVWRGSTLVSALAGNENNIAAVTAIDIWGWDKAETALTEFDADGAKVVFGDAEDALMTTLNRLADLTTSIDNVNIIRDDCFQVDVDELVAENGGQRFNVYFYDAGHTALEQKRAFTHYNRALADVFVTIVDDWNSPGVAAGTKEAFMELGYTVVYGEVLGGGHTHSLSNVRNPWHNGLYVAVVTK